MIFPVTNNVSPFNLAAGAGVWASATTADGFLDDLADASDTDTQVTLSALGQLQSASDTFLNALALLMPPDQTGSTEASSSNPAVVSVAAQSNAPTGSYNITVNNLAQGQTLQSAGFATPDTTVIGSGQLTITFGSYDGSSNTFTPGSAAPIVVSLSNAALDDVASALNTAGGGVTASVQQSGDAYVLLINGSGTGPSQAFEIQANDPSLSALTFDPTNEQGSGLTETQTAQNGSVTVNGATISSDDNGGVTIAPGLSIDLLQPGSSVVTGTPSSADAQAEAQSLVSAFNTVQSSLAAAPISQGEVENVTGPFSNALLQAATASYSTSDSQFSQLSQIGINLQAGASSTLGVGLSLDTGTFDEAMSVDPDGTQALLAAAIQSFNNVALSYGGGGGVLDNAQGAYESALYADQLVQSQPLQAALPTPDQLASVESGVDVLAPTQIQSAQQYARAFAPLIQSAWTSALLTELYTPYAEPAGLLTALA